MSPRIATAVAASLLLALAAGCAAPGAPAADPSASPSPSPSVAPRPSQPEPTIAPPSPNAGDVDAGDAPLLTIELEGPDAIRATLEDPTAAAWGIVVSGVGDLAGDRFELLVETGAAGPTIRAIEVQDGDVVDTMDLSAFVDGSAVAGGCHRRLPVCVDSAGFRIPVDDAAAFSVRLALPEPGVPMRITGATAHRVSGSGALGAWTETATFPWAG